MSDSESFSAKRAIAGSAFGRIKEIVRELEASEKKVGREFDSAQIEFRMAADDIAWYVAYRTDASVVGDRSIERSS
ncbi:hypothetical protein [Paraburkholderia caribensis]|uniref:hypothetical protein n=1 Tax=Paraburkholderia caribensis TaxID=75105 RepID=UPI0028589983|nr:hypothetical protein [Paraburkholderia caribensis]MDR6384027.1 hypothetical protein [Paraburkholderia caribensis]